MTSRPEMERGHMSLFLLLSVHGFVATGIACKPLTSEVRELVERSYANLLDEEGLQDFRARTIVGGLLEGDRRFWHWKRLVEEP